MTPVFTNKLGALIDGAAQGLTYGFSDEIAAGLDSGFGLLGSYEDSLKAEQERMARNQRLAWGYRLAGEIPGMVASAIGTGGIGLLSRGATGGAKLAGAAAEGALYGGLYGAGTSEGDRLEDAKSGAIVGGIAGPIGKVAGDALASGASKAFGMLARKPSTPTLQEVTAKADAAYAKADAANDIIPANSYSDAVERIKSSLANDAYLPGNQPGVRTGLRELQRVQGQNVTHKGLEALRRKVRGGYNPGNKDNNRMLYNMIDELDELGSSSGYAEARKLYSQKAKIEAVKNALLQAEKKAKITGSGGNVDNATRQRLDRVLERKGGWTPDEVSQLQNAAYGTSGRNALRTIGRAAPSTGAMGMTLNAVSNTGGAVSGTWPISLSLTGATEIAKRLGERGTKKSAEEVMRIVANGGKALPKNKWQKTLENEKVRRMLEKALTSGAIVSAN